MTAEDGCNHCGGTGIVPGTEEPDINATGEPCACWLGDTPEGLRELDDLIAFYRARLDEDEAAAKAWMPFGNPTGAQREHIARHDPARVLREAKVGRGLLRRHRAAKTNAQSQPDNEFLRGRLSGYEEALKIAAFTYADNPDYREEWLP